MKMQQGRRLRVEQEAERKEEADQSLIARRCHGGCAVAEEARKKAGWLRDTTEEEKPRTRLAIVARSSAFDNIQLIPQRKHVGSIRNRFLLSDRTWLGKHLITTFPLRRCHTHRSIRN